MFKMNSGCLKWQNWLWIESCVQSWMLNDPHVPLTFATSLHFSYTTIHNYSASISILLSKSRSYFDSWSTPDISTRFTKTTKRMRHWIISVFRQTSSDKICRSKYNNFYWEGTSVTACITGLTIKNHTVYGTSTEPTVQTIFIFHPVINWFC